MIKKPEKCCECGSYDCSVPMPLNGKVRGIDLCVSHMVAALNAGGLATLASCCGHGERPGNIVLDGNGSGDIVLTIQSMCDWVNGQILSNKRTCPIIRVSLKEMCENLKNRTWVECEPSECEYYTFQKNEGMDYHMHAMKRRTDQ